MAGVAVTLMLPRMTPSQCEIFARVYRLAFTACLRRYYAALDLFSRVSPEHHSGDGESQCRHDVSATRPGLRAASESGSVSEVTLYMPYRRKR